MQLNLLSQGEMPEAQLQFAHGCQLKSETKLSPWLIFALMFTDSCLYVMYLSSFVYRLSYPYCTHGRIRIDFRASHMVVNISLSPPPQPFNSCLT